MGKWRGNMNRILFEPGELCADGTVTLADARAEHILNVLGLGVGGVVRSGVVNGSAGTSRIIGTEGKRIRLQTDHTQPAEPSGFDLLLAAPRPKVMKRLWPQLAALGAGRVVVLNAAKVEKCYFSSQWLDPARIRPLLIEGLAQAGTTMLPEVRVRQRFKPFVEDELGTLFPTPLRLLAHPGPVVGLAASEWPSGTRPLIAVGPEGGWTDYERTMLTERGFRPFSLGPRTLRTDTACVALIAVLAWLRDSSRWSGGADESRVLSGRLGIGQVAGPSCTINAERRTENHETRTLGSLSSEARYAD